MLKGKRFGMRVSGFALLSVFLNIDYWLFNIGNYLFNLLSKI